jgi:transposase
VIPGGSSATGAEPAEENRKTGAGAAGPPWVTTARTGVARAGSVGRRASYVTAFRRAFRVPVRTGRRGRPRLALPEGFLVGQVVKPYAQRRVTGVVQRVKAGTAAAITAVLATTQSGRTINTAYIERLNATFRSCLAARVGARPHRVDADGRHVAGGVRRQLLLGAR